MGRRSDLLDKDERKSFRSCGRKRKLKSNEASKLASRFNQRKYLCEFCGGWHLTKRTKWVD